MSMSMSMSMPMRMRGLWDAAFGTRIRTGRTVAAARLFVYLSACTLEARKRRAAGQGSLRKVERCR
jgi:hypothetical protein